VGDTAFDTALILWIGTFLTRGRSWAPLAVSGVLLAASIPQIAVGPFVGVFVDRWDKRRTMLWMDALSATVVALLVLATGAVYLPLPDGGRIPATWQIPPAFGAVVLVTVCAQFYGPARYALIARIVPDAEQTRAMSMSQAIQGLAVIVGPPLAAVLVFTLGFQWALVVNALSFLVSFAAIAAIRAPGTATSLALGERGRFARELWEGLRYVVWHPALRTILISVLLTWLGFGALQVLGYFFVTQNLHAAPSVFGFLGSAFGLGAVGGAVLVTVFGDRIGVIRIFWLSLVTSGTLVIVLAHLTKVGPALGAAFLFGIAATATIIAVGPFILHVTENEFIGRVTAVINPLSRLAALISIVVAGALVGEVLRGFHASMFGITFGPVDTVLTGMGALAVAGGIYARSKLRGVTLAEPSTELQVEQRQEGPGAPQVEAGFTA
jgi:MFS family permease